MFLSGNNSNQKKIQSREREQQQLEEDVEQRGRKTEKEVGRDKQREGYGDRGREMGIFEEREREMMRGNECDRCIKKLTIMIGQN